MKVIKNFVPFIEYQKMKETIWSNDFSWYFEETTLLDIPSEPQFVHIFYSEHTPNSPFLGAINPLLAAIKPLSIFRIKINLNYRTEKIIETGVHCDLEDKQKRFNSAVFFFNECNGYCRVGDEKTLDPLVLTQLEELF
jgi:hypothetical protein